MSPSSWQGGVAIVGRMTWVIGTPSSLGYGVAISDIRVTFPNGQTRDCLQKVYPVGRFIAAGFSGSVPFGFWAIGNLQHQLRHVKSNKAWIPGWVVFKWYRLARRVFAGLDPDMKANGAAVMLVGVSPTVDVGIPGWARPMVAILRAPDFYPSVLKLQEVGAIGSGAGVELYVQELQQIQGLYHDLWQAEVGTPGGYGRILLHLIQQTAQEHPSPGVSHHLHLCLVRRGKITVVNSDHTVFPPNGPSIEMQMPQVATTWSEFKEMCSNTSVDTTLAKC